MSFRGRLSIFFVAIVMVPLIVVGVMLVEVTEDSREGKADARVAAGLEVARGSLSGGAGYGSERR